METAATALEAELNQIRSQAAVSNPYEHPEVTAITDPFLNHAEEMANTVSMLGYNGELLSKSRIHELVNLSTQVGAPGSDGFEERRTQFIDTVVDNFGEDNKTTVLALLPVLTSSGRGSDIMVPMAISSFGGMVVAVLTVFVVPVLYAFVEEIKLSRQPTTPIKP